MIRPHRTCALCGGKIRQKERLCPTCLATWQDCLTEPWMSAIIKESEYQHNVQLRDYGKVISLEKVRTI